MVGRAIDLKGSSKIVGRSENTNRFFEDIRKYPVLSKEEEAELFQIYKTGTPRERTRARDKIIKCNKRLAFACAKRWATEETLMDYTNEANIGLMEAIDSFDETLDIKFSTYAIFFIKRAIVKYYQSQSQMIKKSNFSKTQTLRTKAIAKFEQTYERTPTESELIDFMNERSNRKLKDTRDLMDITYTYIDSESSQNETEEPLTGMSDYYAKSSSLNNVEHAIQKNFHSKLIESMMAPLTQRERRIIKLKYGIGEENFVKGEREPKEIAAIIGLTTERVRQMESRIMKKLQLEYKKRLSSDI